MYVMGAMIPVLEQSIKDWLQAAAWIATAVGIILAAIKFLSELREGRLQRDRDLRWRQAEAGKSLNDEMQDNDRAWSAMQMLDSPERVFLVRENLTITIRHNDIKGALESECKINDEKSTYIRDCFDTFFYYMAMFEHYISSTLILAEDVAYPMEYYVPLMVKFRPEIASYLRNYNLWRTAKFLNRYQAWHDLPQKTIPVESTVEQTKQGLNG